MTCHRFPFPWPVQTLGLNVVCGIALHDSATRLRYYGACLHRAIVNTRASRQTYMLRHHAACLHGAMIINSACEGIIILPG